MLTEVMWRLNRKNKFLALFTYPHVIPNLFWNKISCFYWMAYSSFKKAFILFIIFFIIHYFIALFLSTSHCSLIVGVCLGWFFLWFVFVHFCFLQKGKGMICGSKFNNKQITEIAPWSSAVTRLASVFVCPVCVCLLAGLEQLGR